MCLKEYQLEAPRNSLCNNCVLKGHDLNFIDDGITQDCSWVSKFAKSRDASLRCDVILQTTMRIVRFQGFRWDQKSDLCSTMCIAENCNAFSLRIALSLRKSAAMYATMQAAASITASAMPRCGGLSWMMSEIWAAHNHPWIRVHTKGVMRQHATLRRVIILENVRS